MRRFVVASLVGCLALVAPAALANASVSAAKTPFCKGKTKKTAIKQIKDVWSQVLDYEEGKTVEERFSVVENADDPEFNPCSSTSPTRTPACCPP